LVINKAMKKLFFFVMMFMYGKNGKILQTARDGFGNMVQQRPGQSKNNIYDVKRWVKPNRANGNK